MDKIQFQQEGEVFDAKFNFYGTKLALCTSDGTIQVFSVQQSSDVQLEQKFQAHKDAITRISWSHPKFGNILASTSKDGLIKIWRESSPSYWTEIYSIQLAGYANSIDWAPNHLGIVLAVGQNSGELTALSHQSQNQWIDITFPVHNQPILQLCWAPDIPIPNIQQNQLTFRSVALLLRGNLIKFYSYDDQQFQQRLEYTRETQQILDLSWGYNTAISSHYLAYSTISSQVKIFIIDPELYTLHPCSDLQLPCPIHRLSWTNGGSILGLSSEDKIGRMARLGPNDQWEVVCEINADGEFLQV